MPTDFCFEFHQSKSGGLFETTDETMLTINKNLRLTRVLRKSQPQAKPTPIWLLRKAPNRQAVKKLAFS